MADIEGKKLTELRVIDLKTELERRGLDKTGNKAALLDRLSKAIINDGGDPNECLIIPSGGVRASPKKPIDTSVMIEDVLETDIQKHEFDSKIDESDNVASNVPESNIADLNMTDSNVADNADESVISISAQSNELEMEFQESEQKLEEEHEHEQEQEQEPTITTTSEEPISDEKLCIPEDESSNISAVETNGIDNEDSINLTIGEDEENLLSEETESIDRSKDGGVKKRLEESDNISVGSNNNDSSSSSANNNNNNNGSSSNNNSNNDKKGDCKGGSSRAETGSSSSSSSSNNKEGSSISTTSSGVNATSVKNKLDGEECKSNDGSSKNLKKDEKVSTNTSSRNLWVSGLSSSTRATDLKFIFSNHGKVVGAKVVTNAKTPGSRCYGYITMSSNEDAENCIKNLHRTELHGRVISVEKAKSDSKQSHNRKRELINNKTDKKDEKEKTNKESDNTEKECTEKDDENNDDGAKKKKIDESNKEGESKASGEELIAEREKRENSSETKDEGSLKDCDTRSNKSSGKKSDRERGNSREDKKRSWDRSRASRSKSREHHRSRDNEEREKQRLREKERLLREDKRRRRDDIDRQRAIEREAARLEREREKLRLERERIEQEKAELLRLERERALLLERKKLERERIELKRTQMRIEESRRGSGPAVPTPPGSSSSSGLKRGSGDRPRDSFEPERKRMNAERRNSPPERAAGAGRRMDGHGSGPGGRYDAGRSKDQGPPVHKPPFKRSNDFGRPNNRSDEQYDGRGPANRDNMMRRDTGGSRPHQNTMDNRTMKDRYERPSGFQRDREVHRSDDSHRNSRDNHNRYDNSKPNNSRDGRYVDNNRQTGWHSGPPSKPFNSVNNRNEQQSGWNNRSSDNSRANNNPRWNSNMGNNMGHQRSQMYQSGPSQSYGGMSQGNSGGSYERFDPYKNSMQNMRKY